MQRVETLRVAMIAKIYTGDAAISSKLEGSMELPDKAHGTFESGGE